jgi:hypothetical protein
LKTVKERIYGVLDEVLVTLIATALIWLGYQLWSILRTLLARLALIFVLGAFSIIILVVTIVSAYILHRISVSRELKILIYCLLALLVVLLWIASPSVAQAIRALIATPTPEAEPSVTIIEPANDDSIPCQITVAAKIRNMQAENVIYLVVHPISYPNQDWLVQTSTYTVTKRIIEKIWYASAFIGRPNQDFGDKFEICVV